MSRRAFRAVWISDTHLGSRGCHAAELSRFLKRIDCETLYLVGDIVDFWRLRRGRVFWPPDHHDVLRRMLKLIKRGTRIVLVPGNHDEVLRQYGGMDFGGIQVRHSAIHQCLDGRRLLVTHGDQFDLVVKHSPLLSWIGSAAYERLIVLNRLFNRYRRWRGKPYWSLAQFVKLKVKSACTFVSRYEETLLHDARSRGLDGVVCGHIHKPEFLEDRAPAYFNCGDWIENCTAIVEHYDGSMELLHAVDVIGTGDDGTPPEDDGHAERGEDTAGLEWMHPLPVPQEPAPR